MCALLLIPSTWPKRSLLIFTVPKIEPQSFKAMFFMTKANKFWPHFSFAYFNHKIHLFPYKACQIFITPSRCELVILLFSLISHFLWKGNIYWNMFPLPGPPEIHASSSSYPSVALLTPPYNPSGTWTEPAEACVTVPTKWASLSDSPLRVKSKFWCYSVKSLL